MTLLVHSGYLVVESTGGPSVKRELLLLIVILIVPASESKEILTEDVEIMIKK